MATIEALPTSKLGTQEHWNTVYEREVSNFDALGDKGEVWFGEDAVQRMIDFVQEEAEKGTFEQNKTNVLDVGTGNGHLLFGLLEDIDGTPFVRAEDMLGIDYSAPSIELCKRIAAKSSQDDDDDDDTNVRRIKFQQLDFLQEAQTLQHTRWHLVCDKGTLDAIALSSSSSTMVNTQTPVEQYVKSLSAITQTNDMFLITSCNFTEQELVQLFAVDFDVYHIIPVPSFSFVSSKACIWYDLH